MAVGLLHIWVRAERVGPSLRSVRHYLEIGLVEPTARTKGGSGSTALSRRNDSRSFKA